MSRRRILNITSTKKQDNMLPSLPTTGLPANNGFTTAADGAGALIFCPTFRFLETDSNNTATAVSTAGRNRQTCYARGVKETVIFTVSGPSPVRWRRIVIETTDTIMGTLFYTNTLGNSSTAGRTRPMNTLVGTPEFPALTALIFKGQQQNDWVNIFDAKLDTQRVKVHRDITRTVSPGNATGSTRLNKYWLPLNKNITYGDDEFGEDDISSGFCANNRSTMGNIFMIDFFEPVISGQSTQINFNPQTTYYWHEK